MNNPPPPCKPFTPCWCESRPNHPMCEDTSAVSIDGVPLLFLAVCLMVFFAGKLKKE